MTPGKLPYHVALDKYTNEQAVVKAAKEKAWQCTILRPADFLTNFLEPMSSFRFPELKKENKIRAMLPPETEFDWVDPGEIGKVAAKILLERTPNSSDVQFVELAGGRAALQTVISAMEKAGGVKIDIDQVDREEAKKSDDWVTRTMTGIWLVDQDARIGDWDGAERFGVVPRSIADFFESSKEAIREAVGA
jgi:nucleoside-diphosphate-sugar epimerase